MAAHVLLVDVDAGRSRCHAPSSAGERPVRGRPADILLGDFDRARTEATFEVLRKNLPANEIHRVRSGCEALAFLKRRGELPDPKRRRGPFSPCSMKTSRGWRATPSSAACSGPRRRES